MNTCLDYHKLPFITKRSERGVTNQLADCARLLKKRNYSEQFAEQVMLTAYAGRLGVKKIMQAILTVYK